jgi:hypothetical protein
MSVLKKRDSRPTAGSAGEGIGSCSVGSMIPGLMEMLTSVSWPDGSRRVASTLLLFSDEGFIKACLNDRDQGLTAWSSGVSLTACLLALEQGLANDSLAWRPPAGSGKTRKGNRA